MQRIDTSSCLQNQLKNHIIRIYILTYRKSILKVYKLFCFSMKNKNKIVFELHFFLNKTFGQITIMML